VKTKLNRRTVSKLTPVLTRLQQGWDLKKSISIKISGFAQKKKEDLRADIHEQMSLGKPKLIIFLVPKL
jgi:hypothetical protein